MTWIFKYIVDIFEKKYFGWSYLKIIRKKHRFTKRKSQEEEKKVVVMRTTVQRDLVLGEGWNPPK